MKKVLIVDDERPISDIIKFNLTKEGYEVETAFNGREAIDMFHSTNPDLIILDLMLPEIDGLEVAREVRKTSHIPIIMLSAKDSEVDKVIGLEIGADDYVTKPFSNRELLARVKAHLRRTGNIENAIAEEKNSQSDESITIGDLQINPNAYSVRKRGQEIELTHREFELLYHLAKNAGQVMSRDNLLEVIWGFDYFGDERTVDVTVRRLREKIEDVPGKPEYILTRRSVGYFMRNDE